MSMITSCPVCLTRFRVVPDQLRVSEGWVRCGQCHHVFDATPQTKSTPPLIADTEPLPELVVERMTEPQSDANAEPGMDAKPLVEQEIIAIEPTSAESLDELLLASEPATTASSATNAELDSITFLNHSNTSSSFWRDPMVRFNLVMLNCALVFGLLLQIVIHERDTIVAAVPTLEPWLLAICRPLDCALSPPRRLDSLVVESASFGKVQDDNYRLNFSIKNQYSTALAVPAVELTLTDTLDQPIVRRVFLPAEAGAKFNTLGPDSVWRASLALSIKSAGIPGPFVGYRVLAFYP
jgi:predicted Zn finger-like uncharacterized protein